MVYAGSTETHQTLLCCALCLRVRRHIAQHHGYDIRGPAEELYPLSSAELPAFHIPPLSLSWVPRSSTHWCCLSRPLHSFVGCSAGTVILFFNPHICPESAAVAAKKHKQASINYENKRRQHGNGRGQQFACGRLP